jgi:hypothetical protein
MEPALLLLALQGSLGEIACRARDLTVAAGELFARPRVRAK